MRYVVWLAFLVFLLYFPSMAISNVQIDEPVRAGYDSSVAILSGGRITCSGVIVSPKEVLTAAHCSPFVDTVDSVLLVDKTRVKVVGRRFWLTKWDLALLILEKEVCCVAILHDLRPLVGVQVYYWGAPGGTFPLISYGYISGIFEDSWKGDNYGTERHEIILIGGTNLLPGASGGGWYWRGRLIGIHVRGYVDTTMGLPLGWSAAVGITTIRKAFEEVRR